MRNPLLKLVVRCILVAVALIASSCAEPSSTLRGTSSPVAGATAQPAVDSKRTLTLAWNRETYEVPEPAVLTPAMRETETFRKWWKVGDVRTLEFNDDAGRRVAVEMIGRGRDETGVLKPIMQYSYRYRADSTLEVKTANMSDGPAEWTIYAADGKTPSVRVVNRLNGIEGTPFIQNVYFFDAPGKQVRGYQANRYGVAYIEWFYNPDGSPHHWNGSAKLDGPLAAK